MHSRGDSRLQVSQLLLKQALEGRRRLLDRSVYLFFLFFSKSRLSQSKPSVEVGGQDILAEAGQGKGSQSLLRTRVLTNDFPLIQKCSFVTINCSSLKNKMNLFRKIWHGVALPCLPGTSPDKINGLTRKWIQSHIKNVSLSLL